MLRRDDEELHTVAIEVGSKAPAFTLQDQNGEEVSLEGLRGSPVIIYFYPKDDTPGCTTQACGIRDDWDAFQERGVTVLGVSPDDPASHTAFREKYDLPHTLLSDPEHRVMEEYDAWGEKVLYGKRKVGVKRSTVLLDDDGTVVKHWKRATPKTHAQQVLAAIDDLRAD